MHLDLVVVNNRSADSSGLKPPRNDKREAVGALRLRSGQTLKSSIPKAHERDARAYIDGIFAGEGARATRPASTSVTCRARRKRPTSLSLNGESLSGARIERASVVRSPHIGEKR